MWGGGGGGVHVTCSKLKLIKYVSTEENDEELDRNLICKISFVKAVVDMVPRKIDLV